MKNRAELTFQELQDSFELALKRYLSELNLTEVPEDFGVLGLGINYVEAVNRSTDELSDYFGWFLIVSNQGINNGLEPEARQFESFMAQDSSVTRIGAKVEPWMVTDSNDAQNIKAQLEDGADATGDRRQFDIFILDKESI